MVDREQKRQRKGEVGDTASCSQSTRIMHGNQEWIIMPFGDASESSYKEERKLHVYRGGVWEA